MNLGKYRNWPVRRRIVFSFLMIVVLMIGLFIVASFNVERLMKSIINHYLAPFDTQVTQVEVSPKSLFHWSIPNLTLQVNQDQIKLSHIDIYFKQETSLLQLSATDLRQIDIQHATINLDTSQLKQRLNHLLAPKPNAHATDSRFDIKGIDPDFASWLSQLPSINVGESHFYLNHIADNVPSLGLIESTTLHQGNLNMDTLRLDYLQLDALHLKKGKLTAALSIQKQRLWSIDAQLTSNQWQLSSQLSLTQLDRALNTLSTVMEAEPSASKNDTLAMWYANMTDLGFPRTGNLHSQISLQILPIQHSSANHSDPVHQSADLYSTHLLCDAQWVLPSITSANKSPSLSKRDNTPLHVSSLAQNRTEPQQAACHIPNIDVTLIGPLSNLSLTIQPVTVSISPSQAQLSTLIDRLHLPTELLNLFAILDRKDDNREIEHNPPHALLNLTVERPISLNMASKILQLPEAEITLNLARLKTAVHVSNLIITPTQVIPTTTHPAMTAIMTKVSKNSEKKPTATSTAHITAKWAIEVEQTSPIQFNLSQLTPVSSTHPVNPTFNDMNVAINELRLTSQGAFTHQNNDLRDQYHLLFDSPFSMSTGQLSLNDAPVLLPTSNAKKNLTTQAQPHALMLFNTKKSQLTLASGSELTYIPDAQITLTLAPADLVLTNTNAELHHQDGTVEQRNTVNKITLPLNTTRQKQAQQNTPVNETVNQISMAHLHVSLTNELTLSHLFKSLTPKQSNNKMTGNHSNNASYLKAPVSTFSMPVFNHILDSLDLSETEQIKEQITLNIEQFTVNKWVQPSHSPLKNKPQVKLDPKHASQAIIHLKQVNLSQSIKINKKRISTQERWHVNALPLTSEHQLYLSDATEPNLLTGKWHFTHPLNELIALFKEVKKTSVDLDVTGMSTLELSYQTQISTPITDDWLFTLDANAQDIAGQFNQLPFDGADLQVKCQYRLPSFLNKESIKPIKHKNNTAETSFKSPPARPQPLDCTTLNLSVAAFNPGIIITSLNIQAALAQSISIETKQSSTIGSTKKEQHTWSSFWQRLRLNQTQLEVSLTGDTLKGQLALPEFRINTQGDTEAYLLLQGVSLNELLTLHPVAGVYADGIFDAVLPIVYNQGKLKISGGKLTSRPPGGLIAVTDNPSVEQMKLSQPYLDFAFSALQHLEYSELSSHFDMTANGDATLQAQIKGKSRGVKRPIIFNYTQEENLLQLLRSLQISGNLQSEIERVMKTGNE